MRCRRYLSVVIRIFFSGFCPVGVTCSCKQVARATPLSLSAVAHNFTTPISFDGRTLLATLVPSMRGNGMHYEVNIPGYPRFWVRWGVTDRYEVVKPTDVKLPDALVLAVSDAIEAAGGRH